MLLSSAAFTAMGVFTKLAVEASSAMDTVFWRSVVVMIVSAALALVGRQSLRPNNVRLIGARSIAGLISMSVYFWALGNTPLATATVLQSMSPIFTVLLARRFGGDGHTPGALPLVLLAFGGVIMILGPTELHLTLGTVACLTSAFLSAVAYIAVRKMRDSDPPTRIVFWFSVVASLGSLPFVDAQAFTPSPELMLWYALVGVSAAAGQLLMTMAYGLERAAVIGPFAYATPILTYGVGLIWFPDEHPTLMATAGILCVIVAGARLSGMARRAV